MARHEIKQQPDLIINEETQEAWEILPSGTHARIPYPGKHARQVIIAAAKKRQLAGYKPNLRAVEAMVAREPTLKEEMDWLKTNYKDEDWEEVPKFVKASQLKLNKTNVTFRPKGKDISIAQYFLDKQTDSYMNTNSLCKSYHNGYISVARCGLCGSFLEAWPSCYQKDYILYAVPFCIVCKMEEKEMGCGLEYLEKRVQKIKKIVNFNSKVKHLFIVRKLNNK